MQIQTIAVHSLDLLMHVKLKSYFTYGKMFEFFRQAIAELRSDSTTCKNTAKRETPKAKNPKKRPAKKKVTNKVGKQNSIENYLVKVQKNM